jgi:hypothetical protein
LDELITLEEAATIRKVSARTIRRMGTGPNAKLKLVKPSPGRIMISRREAMRGI